MRTRPDSVTINYSAEWEVNPYPGYLIVIDSLDGSGKGTQQENLMRGLKLRGAKAVLTNEPTNGPFGAPIRLALTHRLVVDDQTLQMAFSTDRSDDLLRSGGTVDNLRNGLIEVKDRYFWSTLAYGYGLGLDMDWLTVLQLRFPIPDVSFYVKVSPRACIERIEKSRRPRERFETIERLSKAEEGYKILQQRFPDNIVVLDGQTNSERITAEMFARLERDPKFTEVLNRQRNLPE